MSSTAVVFVGALVGFGAAHYALLNLAASAAWIAVALKLRKTTLVSKQEPPISATPELPAPQL